MREHEHPSHDHSHATHEHRHEREQACCHPAHHGTGGAAPLPQAARTSSAAEWTCPMHPEVVRPGPGACPICGMALEPRTPVLSEEDGGELRDMQRRFFAALVLTAPLFALTMGDMLLGHALGSLISPRVRGFVELALATPVCVWAAWPFHERGVRSLKSRHFNMFTLISLGVSVAYGF